VTAVAQTPIRILLADDHPIVLEGLSALVSRAPDMDVVAEAKNGREALEQAARHHPDVALIDLRMPEMDGVSVMLALREHAPEVRVVILSTFSGDEDVYRALRAGARAYLLKDTAREELLSCIRSVHAGAAWVSPAAAARLTARLGASELTPREQEVLALIAAGRNNREIADQLRVAEGTVKAHVNRILSKLHVSSRAEAITVAVRRGLVHFDT